jgi:hypothetical protein
MHRNFKREEFEELIQPMTDRFQAILLDTLERSGKYKIF